MTALNPPVAVVTGGNRGLGLETGRQLAQRGLTVVLTSRNPAQGQRAADRLRAQGLTVVSYPLEVTASASVTALAAALRQEFGQIEVLINNAGVALDDFNAEVARRTLAVNCFGVITVVDHLLPLLSPHGRIVMVSSGMGQVAGLPPALQVQFLDPTLTRARLMDLLQTFVRDVESGQHIQHGWPSNAYRISKVGLNAFTRLLARELAPTAIRVNTVCPGWVRTDMGGRNAPRSVEEGVRGIVWAALLGEEGPSGGFFRDGRPISW
ncbi:MAG: short-chain dehydrogenase/reductase [Proteobacteria bacterium]|nr:short-chain dehydrogenase/reductase [Pseudomonadota bacterium]